MSRHAPDPAQRVADILAQREPRPIELPHAVVNGRFAVTRPAVFGVVVIVALAVAMLFGRHMLAKDERAPQPVTTQDSPGGQMADSAQPASSPSASSGVVADPGDAGPGSGSARQSTKVTVHIAGQVRRPGVVTLSAGSRVAAAIEEAGGETSSADLGGINLARPLVDGEQVFVPKPGESPPAVTGPSVAPGSPAPGSPAGQPGPTGQGSPVNLNTADLTTLETLPGVGPVLAQRILDWRTENGQFTAVEELGEVSGIGDKTYAQLAPKVTV